MTCFPERNRNRHIWPTQPYVQKLPISSKWSKQAKDTFPEPEIEFASMQCYVISILSLLISAPPISSYTLASHTGAGHNSCLDHQHHINLSWIKEMIIIWSLWSKGNSSYYDHQDPDLGLNHDLPQTECGKSSTPPGRKCLGRPSVTRERDFRCAVDHLLFIIIAINIILIHL